jgi:hypothetical protein
VDRVDNPVDARITADSLVLRIHEDNLEVFVCRVLVNPVRVQDAEIGATATDTLFSGGTEGALVLELVDTLVGRLACEVILSDLSDVCSTRFPIPYVAPFGAGRLRPPRRTRMR